MKKLIVILGIYLFLVTPSIAQDQKEELCAKSIDATIAAIEAISKQTGTEQKLKDLSVEAIRKMQKVKGSCATMKEINKRTMN